MPMTFFSSCFASLFFHGLNLGLKQVMRCFVVSDRPNYALLLQYAFTRYRLLRKENEEKISKAHAPKDNTVLRHHLIAYECALNVPSLDISAP